MRLFIAINLPGKERQRIERSARPLQNRDLPIRWVPPENYHVTLKFLGNIRTSRIPDVRTVMEKVGRETTAFELEFADFGAFPTIRRPQVLWLGVTASPALRCLKQDLEWGLAEHGFSRETRAFHPHVTLGRARPEGGAGIFRGLDELTAEMAHTGRIRVHSIDLIQSLHASDGPEYAVVESVRLTGE